MPLHGYIQCGFQSIYDDAPTSAGCHGILCVDGSVDCGRICCRTVVREQPARYVEAAVRGDDPECGEDRTKEERL